MRELRKPQRVGRDTITERNTDPRRLCTASIPGLYVISFCYCLRASAESHARFQESSYEPTDAAIRHGSYIKSADIGRGSFHDRQDSKDASKAVMAERRSSGGKRIVSSSRHPGNHPPAFIRRQSDYTLKLINSEMGTIHAFPRQTHSSTVSDFEEECDNRYALSFARSPSVSAESL